MGYYNTTLQPLALLCNFPNIACLRDGHTKVPVSRYHVATPYPFAPVGIA